MVDVLDFAVEVDAVKGRPRHALLELGDIWWGRQEHGLAVATRIKSAGYSTSSLARVSMLLPCPAARGGDFKNLLGVGLAYIVAQAKFICLRLRTGNKVKCGTSWACNRLDPWITEVLSETLNIGRSTLYRYLKDKAAPLSH